MGTQNWYHASYGLDGSYLVMPNVESLEELYAPHNSSNTIVFTVPDIRERCVSLGVASRSGEVVSFVKMAPSPIDLLYF